MVNSRRSILARITRKIVPIIVIGVIIVFKNYVIVIGQTPVLVALNKSDATLSIVDPSTMTVKATIPTGRGPHEVVISADGKFAYAANYGDSQPGNSISIVNLADGKEVQRVDLGPLLRPHGLQIIGKNLYFTAEVNRAIARLNTSTGKVDWIMGTGQNGSHMVAVSADERRFYTANIGSDSVTAIEFNSVPPGQSKIIQIPVGKQPEAIDLSPNGEEVWVGLNEEGSVEVVDTKTNRSVQKINVGGRPYRVEFLPDGRTVACTLLPTREIVLIDAQTKRETKRIKLESVPLGIAFTADGKTAFVSVVQPDAVLKVDLEKGEVTGRVETGKVPDGIAVTGM